MKKYRIVKTINPGKGADFDYYIVQKQHYGFLWLDYVPYGKNLEKFSSMELAEKSIFDIPCVQASLSKKIIVKNINFKQKRLNG